MPRADTAPLVSLSLRSDDDLALPHQLPSADTGFRTANVRLVHCDHSSQGFRAHSVHRSPQLKEQEQRRSTASQTDLALRESCA